MAKYAPVIGLEIHVELKTSSKMFCQCNADYFGKTPNSQTCPVCLGMPGALPVPNKKAVEWALLIGKALGCKINKISKFDRKHYFYPDLPKGYQISQYDEPFCTGGAVEIKSQIPMINKIPNPKPQKKFGITRVHLEEDTGKLLHVGSETLVDFNRSGVPLVEIVTEPDFDNSDDVKRFLEELQVIIRYLGVSDADMEKGTMRLEPNISVKKLNVGTGHCPVRTRKELPSYKVEVKNINSFRFVKQAIDFEVERQIEQLEKGETPKQETRGFDAKKVVTYSQRSKEEAQDYRYFPEPDIPPIVLTDEYIDSIKVPTLPQQKLELFIKQGIKYQDAFTITRDKNMVDKVDRTLKLNSSDAISTKDIVNVIINRKGVADLQPHKILEEVKKRKQPVTTDVSKLTKVINKIIRENEKVVRDYQSGKVNAVMFLVGQVMREMKGQADANIVRESLIKKIQSSKSRIKN